MKYQVKRPERRDLSFARSYHEATGKRLHPRDFDEPMPHITGKDAAFWIVAIAILCGLAYVMKG